MDRADRPRRDGGFSADRAGRPAGRSSGAPGRPSRVDSSFSGRNRESADRGGRDEQWTPRAASAPAENRGRGAREKAVPVTPTKTELWESAGWESGENQSADAVAVPEVTIERVPKRLAAPLAVSKEVSNAVGPRRAPKVEAALMEASKAFDRERYGDALTILRALADETPDVPAVRELFGLALYRQGKWNDALKHLVRFVELTGSVEQHPVIADCHRALRHHDLVQTYWDELAASSPSAELVAEGRIVMAGSFADQGRLGEAIALLERAPLQTKRPRAHHLRLWYALGDLYERAGDVPNAREWFARVLLHDPELADTKERLENL